MKKLCTVFRKVRKQLPFLSLVLAFFLLGTGFMHRGSQNKVTAAKTMAKRSALARGAARYANRTFSEKDVTPGVVIVKLKSPASVAKGASRTGLRSVDRLFETYKVYAIEQAFPFMRYSTLKGAEKFLQYYYVKYQAKASVAEICADFTGDPNIEIAEPLFRMRVQEVPNDPRYSEQEVQYDLVHLPQAWEIVKGDTGKVLVAIVDGGTDWKHEDLQANIWTNEDEVAGNNIDDDGNGFIDDVHGWNFARDTADPTGSSSTPINASHGTQTAGAVSAVANNGLGIAGTSWNAKYMPINTSAPEDSLGLQFPLSGILYATNNGADIINTSFGGVGGAQIFEEIVNFAHDNGALIIAAAGNGGDDGLGDSNDDTPHFPANYRPVLSVGSLDDLARVSVFSNYGATVDVYAPGERVLLTDPDNSYARVSGTSFSTPIVVGIAALLKSRHPDWTVDQLREQLRVTAVNIDDRNEPRFRGLLGKGRIDALRALTIDSLPSIRITDASFTGGGPDGAIDPGETIDLSVEFTNYLASAANISFTLKPISPEVILKNGNAVLPLMNTNDTSAVTFQIEVNTRPAQGALLQFYVDVEAGEYRDRDLLELLPNPPQALDIGTGLLQTTITSEGNIGFVDNDGDGTGIGLTLNGFNYLFEGGLLIATDASSVSNSVRGPDGFSQDNDFRPAAGSFLKLTSPGLFADEEGEIVLIDSLAPQPTGLRILQQTYAFNVDPFNRFIIFRYTIENPLQSAVPEVYAALFFDWDINEDALDFARFDAARNMSIAQNFSSNPTRIAATKVLTAPGVTGYHAIDNRQELDDGFLDSEKWLLMTSGILTTDRNNLDISTFTSTGPRRIEANGSVDVAFALLAAENLTDLQNNADAVQYLWENGLLTDMNTDRPEITTSIFQNPAASKYADVVVVSNRSLTAPPVVKLAADGSPASIAMSRLFGTISIYKGEIEFTGEGNYTITTTAEAIFTGADTTQSRSFQVVLAKPGRATQLTLQAGKASLAIAGNSVSEETYIIGQVEKREEETIYRFSPHVRLAQPVELALRFDPAQGSDPGKFFIYRENGKIWEPLQSRVYAEAGLVKAETAVLGRFKLVYDEGFAGSNKIPEAFALQQNYPNPFNPATTIAYELPEAGPVTLKIYNPLGQVVRTLVQGRQQAGRYLVRWDARHANGRRVASGVYFYQLKATGFTKTRKMILLQ